MPPRSIVTRSLLSSFVLLVLAGLGRADAFDDYTNPLLNKAMASDAAKEMKRVTPDDLLNNDRVLPGVDGAVLVVKTNQGRNAKLVAPPRVRRPT